MNYSEKNSAAFHLTAIDLFDTKASFFQDKNSSQPNGEKFIVFCSGGSFFAVPATQVSEIVQMLPITPLPNVPEWLLGIADLRGKIISVVSTQKLFGVSAENSSSKTKFIILKLQGLHSAVAAAVDKIGEIIVFPNEEIKLIKDENAPYLFGETAYKSNRLKLINVEVLLASLSI